MIRFVMVVCAIIIFVIILFVMVVCAVIRNAAKAIDGVLGMLTFFVRIIFVMVIFWRSWT